MPAGQIVIRGCIIAIVACRPSRFTFCWRSPTKTGYAIIQDVERRTGGELKLGAGTLYRSIHRMLEQGRIEEKRSRPAPALDDERRRYYRITKFGVDIARAEPAQVCATVTLPVCSGLLVQAMWRVQGVDPGFRPEGVLTLRTGLPASQYARLDARGSSTRACSTERGRCRAFYPPAIRASSRWSSALESSPRTPLEIATQLPSAYFS